MRKRVIVFGLIITALVFLAVVLPCFARAADAPNETQVTIDNFSFTPATLTVIAGTRVTWTNHDDIPHTVAESDLKFKSKALDTNDSFSHDFTKPGTYEYFCSLHPKMVAKIIVQPKK